MYILAVFLILVLLVIMVYIFYMIYSQLKGGPFIPTSKNDLHQILSQANLKPNQIVYELGSGDGRVLIEAAKICKITGVGIEINPFLVFYSNLLSIIQNIKGVSFKRADLFKINLSKANIIFIFLLPQTVKALTPKILKECSKNTLIISHGFKIESLEKKLIKKIDHKIFPTYFYKL